MDAPQAHDRRRRYVATIQAADWLEVVEDPVAQDLGLDAGETAAILLAEKVGAEALLIDERRGRGVAAARGIAVIGTLGIGRVCGGQGRWNARYPSWRSSEPTASGFPILWWRSSFVDLARPLIESVAGRPPCCKTSPAG